MQYTISAVAPNPREYETKFGQFISYKVKLAEEADAVEISQKASTPAPTPGQVVEGHIEEGQYGKKFKKDFAGGGGGNFQRAPSGNSTPSSAGTSSKGKFSDDPFTMYLAYAKDILVAQLETSGYDAAKYKELLAAAINGGKALYNQRPGAAPVVTPDSTPAPSFETPPTKEDTVIEDVFGDPGQYLPDDGELPWGS